MNFYDSHFKPLHQSKFCGGLIYNISDAPIFFWFHPITIVIKILILDFYWYIGYKTNPHENRNEHCFCNNKRYYCSGSSPKSTFTIFFQKDQKSFFHVNVLGHDIYFQSQMFYSVIKHSSPSTYIIHQSYYNIQQVLSFFMNMVHIFGVITE